MKCDELIKKIKQAYDDSRHKFIPINLDITIVDLLGAFAELKAENESLKYSVATLETDIAMSQRWRKCSEELPTEDMEGEDFIVSNGFYSVICEWRGYWNNEPFMGDKNCDTVKYWTFAPKAPEVK